jgi:hypothetical protein
MALATASDVAALLARELDTSETAMIDRRLEQVERMILRRIPNLLEQIEAEEIDGADVRDIEAEAVYRVAKYPDGIVAEGDGQYTYQKIPCGSRQHASHPRGGVGRARREAQHVMQLIPGIGCVAL